MLAKDIEQEIRADERKRVATALRAVGNAQIRNPDSDGIDGYAGAVLLDVADEIENGSV